MNETEQKIYDLAMKYHEVNMILKSGGVVQLSDNHLIACCERILSIVVLDRKQFSRILGLGEEIKTYFQIKGNQ